MSFLTQTKTNWKYILIVLSLTGIVAGGILVWQYFWVPKIEVLKEEVKIPVDETANWKIYRNEEYGFEMRYPSDWSVEEKNSYRGVVRLYNPKSSFTSFEVVTGINPDRLTLDEWFTKSTVIQGRPTIEASAKPITINSVKFYKLDSGLLEFPNPVFKAFTSNPQRQILIIVANAETRNDIIVLERILSTFRFFDEQ